MEKKGAMELSISTIVVIVLAMAMLILGVVLVNKIYTGAKYNVDTINSKVEQQIKGLFSEDQKMVIYLADQVANVKQGKSFGVAFGVKDKRTGVSEKSVFSYVVEVANPNEVKENCHISEKIPLSWIPIGRESPMKLMSDESSGETKNIWKGLIRFQIPENAPLCIVRYNINVYADKEFYVADFFDVSIEA